MKVLVACEFSGIVRDAFAELGHDAISCDLLPSEKPGKHYQGDVLDILNDGWDLMVAHPPCTYLTVTGSKWYYHPDDKDLPIEKRRAHPKFPNRAKEREYGVAFFMTLANSNINRIAIENPVGIMSTRWRKPDQIIQPWLFGDSVSKRTCLWLKNLPQLKPTQIVNKGEFIEFRSGKRMPKWYNDCAIKAKTTGERRTLRSKTFPGIAKAIANQWGKILLEN